MKGITILALGSWYGKWAANLAASIRYNSGIPICLLHDKEAVSHFTGGCYSLFTELKEIPKEFYSDFGMRNEVKAKLRLFELSPFDETVYIDAENILTPMANVDDLFRKKLVIQSRNTAMAEEVTPSFIHWADARQIVKMFGLKGKIYNIFSEYMYFKKNKKTEKVFSDAQKVWTQLFGSQVVTQFNGAVPDEICFMVALNQNKVDMEVYCPTYWEHYDRQRLRAGRKELLNWPIYSMGGNRMSQEMQDVYNGPNSYVKTYCQRQGINPFLAMDKARISSKRVNL